MTNFLRIFQQRKAGIFLFLVILATVLVRLVIAFEDLKKPARLNIINLNAEAARNLVEGRGFVVDKNLLNETLKQEEKIGHLIDPEDLKAPSWHKASYTPFSYEDEVGYPLFLAGLWKMTEAKRYIYASLFHILLAACAVIMLFSMAHQLFGIWTAVLAGLMYAFYFHEAQIAATPHQYAWVGFFAIFSAWILFLMARTKSIRWQVLSAILLGILAGSQKFL